MSKPPINNKNAANGLNVNAGDVIDKSKYLRHAVASPESTDLGILIADDVTQKLFQVDLLLPEWNDKINEEMSWNALTNLPDESLTFDDTNNIDQKVITLQEYYGEPLFPSPVPAVATTATTGKKDKNKDTSATAIFDIYANKSHDDHHGHRLPQVKRTDILTTPSIVPSFNTNMNILNSYDISKVVFKNEQKTNPYLCTAYKLVSMFATPTNINMPSAYLATTNSTATTFVREGTGLWKSIYPQSKLTGEPCYNPAGYYFVRLFLSGKWRAIKVSHLIPLNNMTSNISSLVETNLTESHSTDSVTATESLTPVPAVPLSQFELELWPIILSKAIYIAYKICGHCKSSNSNNIDSKQEDMTYSIDFTRFAVHALTGWLPCRVNYLLNDIMITNDITTFSSSSSPSSVIADGNASNLENKESLSAIDVEKIKQWLTRLEEGGAVVMKEEINSPSLDPPTAYLFPSSSSSSSSSSSLSQHQLSPLVATSGSALVSQLHSEILSSRRNEMNDNKNENDDDESTVLSSLQPSHNNLNLPMTKAAIMPILQMTKSQFDRYHAIKKTQVHEMTRCINERNERIQQIEMALNQPYGEVFVLCLPEPISISSSSSSPAVHITAVPIKEAIFDENIPLKNNDNDDDDLKLASDGRDASIVGEQPTTVSPSNNTALPLMTEYVMRYYPILGVQRSFNESNNNGYDSILDTQFLLSWSTTHDDRYKVNYDDNKDNNHNQSINGMENKEVVKDKENEESLHVKPTGNGDSVDTTLGLVGHEFAPFLPQLPANTPLKQTFITLRECLIRNVQIFSFQTRLIQSYQSLLPLRWLPYTSINHENDLHSINTHNGTVGNSAANSKGTPNTASVPVTATTAAVKPTPTKKSAGNSASGNTAATLSLTDFPLKSIDDLGVCISPGMLTPTLMVLNLDHSTRSNAMTGENSSIVNPSLELQDHQQFVNITIFIQTDKIDGKKKKKVSCLKDSNAIAIDDVNLDDMSNANRLHDSINMASDVESNSQLPLFVPINGDQSNNNGSIDIETNEKVFITLEQLNFISPSALKPLVLEGSLILNESNLCMDRLDFRIPYASFANVNTGVNDDNNSDGNQIIMDDNRYCNEFSNTVLFSVKCHTEQSICMIMTCNTVMQTNSIDSFFGNSNTTTTTTNTTKKEDSIVNLTEKGFRMVCYEGISSKVYQDTDQILFRYYLPLLSSPSPTCDSSSVDDINIVANTAIAQSNIYMYPFFYTSSKEVVNQVKLSKFVTTDSSTVLSVINTAITIAGEGIVYQSMNHIKSSMGIDNNNADADAAYDDCKVSIQGNTVIMGHIDANSTNALSSSHILRFAPIPWKVFFITMQPTKHSNNVTINNDITTVLLPAYAASDALPYYDHNHGFRYQGSYHANNQLLLYKDVMVVEKSTFPIALKLITTELSSSSSSSSVSEQQPEDQFDIGDGLDQHHLDICCKIYLKTNATSSTTTTTPSTSSSVSLNLNTASFGSINMTNLELLKVIYGTNGFQDYFILPASATSADAGIEAWLGTSASSATLAESASLQSITSGTSSTTDLKHSQSNASVAASVDGKNKEKEKKNGTESKSKSKQPPVKEVSSVELLIECYLVIPKSTGSHHYNKYKSRNPYQFIDGIKLTTSDDNGDHERLKDNLLRKGLFSWQLDILAGKVISLSHDLSYLEKFNQYKNSLQTTFLGTAESSSTYRSAKANKALEFFKLRKSGHFDPAIVDLNKNSSPTASVAATMMAEILTVLPVTAPATATCEALALMLVTPNNYNNIGDSHKEESVTISTDEGIKMPPLCFKSKFLSQHALIVEPNVPLQQQSPDSFELVDAVNIIGNINNVTDELCENTTATNVTNTPIETIKTKEEYQTDVIESSVKKLNHFSSTLKLQAQHQVQAFLDENKSATQVMIENWKKREAYRMEVIELHKRATTTNK